MPNFGIILVLYGETFEILRFCLKEVLGGRLKMVVQLASSLMGG